eukprot:TRINITY_DN70232_c0_g1_i1.p1 TRINITY_DN70232_c0_g1~~TRINITY_DN70232_c0_g1_i1.p1  ORF type:complete len:284 (-),score=42.05 TRINITY_DN70232_c0_g1_i1:81-821(-)
MVRLFGLTGPIACGKSTVADRVQAAGIPIVDADRITHRLYAEKGRMHNRVVAAFGDGILNEDGAIDRKKLSAVVFGDPAKLRALNQATHGPIMQALLLEVMSLVLTGHRRIILDIPLLAKFHNFRRWVLTGTVVVIAPPEVQLKRLMDRNGFSEDEALGRIKQQASAEEQRKMANFVVDNRGTLADLEKEVDSLLRDLPRGWSLYEVVLAIGAVGAVAIAVPWKSCLAGIMKALTGKSAASSTAAL